MATLTIRNLPDEVHDALRRQAAEHRRSMEAEAREVLQAAVRPRPTEAERRQAIANLQAMGAELKAKRGEPEGWSGVDEFLAEKHLEAIWENGWVTNEERRGWLDRLGRFEVWPEELEAFVAERVAAHQ
jgi:plasmid stability protein